MPWVTSSTPPGLSRFNLVDADTAAALLRAVCASSAWGAEVVAGRPYGDLAGLLVASDGAMAGLGEGDLREAMDAHPPIGRPVAGESAREQAGVGEDERAELLELNLAYQEVHGHVFLICATGATGAEIRAALRERIGNDTPTEREIVRTELGKINRIRLSRLAETAVQEGTP